CEHYLFFQAEDGIRDFHVTGVQTCALPIFDRIHRKHTVSERGPNVRVLPGKDLTMQRHSGLAGFHLPDTFRKRRAGGERELLQEIDRASCRERVEAWGVDGRLRREERPTER